MSPVSAELDHKPETQPEQQEPQQPKGRTRRGGRSLFVIGMAVVLGCLIVVPVALLVLGSFLQEPPRAFSLDFDGAGLRSYVAVLTDPQFPELVRTTLVASVLGTAGAVVLGSILAWLVTRTDVWGRRLLAGAAITPLFLSPLVAAFAWDLLASPKAGLLNIAIRSTGLNLTLNVYSLTGIVFVFAYCYSPYVYLFVSASLRNMDASLEEASQISGAGRLETMRRVTLPLAMPALLSSSLLVLVLLIQLFSIPAILAGPADLDFVSVRIWELVGAAPPRTNEASAFGVLLIVTTFLLVYAQNRMLKKRSYVTVGGKTTAPRRIKLGWTRLVWSAFAVSYVVVAVALPYTALVISGLRTSPFYTDLASLFDPSQFSFDQVSETLEDAVIQAAIGNTIIVSLATVILGSVLYFTVSYTVHKTDLRGRQALSYLTTLPVAIPGLIIGLGYVWAWITVPVGIYGSVVIIVLAYVSQFAPQGVRATTGTLMQIHPELEESSRVSGAGLATTIRRIVLPLSRHGILAGMVLMLVLSARELATALFLYTPDSRILSVTLFDFYSRGYTSPVAILSIVQSLVLMVLILASQWWGRDKGADTSSGRPPTPIS
ncbi:MAG: ABC transporter permease [Micromonosporaceae bacterium]